MLNPKDVLVYVVPTDHAGWEALSELWLSPDERRRLERLAPEQRRQFSACRVTLRATLATHLGCPPRALRFVRGPYGKLRLTNDALAFSVSYTSRMGLVAVSRATSVGVDVELEHSLPDLLPLARQVCCATEYRALVALPGPQRLGHFFRCWTRKEAFVKALGTGMWQRFNRIDIGLTRDAPVAVRHNNGDPWGQWSLYEVPLAPPYRAAVAVTGDARVRLAHVTPEAFARQALQAPTFSTRRTALCRRAKA